MMRPLEGVRIVEVSSWLFVPAAGAILADIGADVIKVDHPSRPDPLGGLAVGGLGEPGEPFRPLLSQANRGKRSLGLDINSAGGREIFLRLIKHADVFLTNLLPGSLGRLGIDPASLQAINPRLIFARGSGFGPVGPDADSAGFDATAYWARAGYADTLTPKDAVEPPPVVAGIGDLPGGVALAGAVAAALFQRERTGRAAVVDVSLLGLGLWNGAPRILGAANDPDRVAKPARMDVANPLSLVYRTRDQRFIKLSFLQSDRVYADFCERIGRPDLITDERFLDSSQRAKNRVACIAELDAVFASLDYSDVLQRLDGIDGAWAVLQNAHEVVKDPQVAANGYLLPVANDPARTVLVASPWTFGGENVSELPAAPEHGQHTEEIILDLGYSWEQIAEFKSLGTIT